MRIRILDVVIALAAAGAIAFSAVSAYGPGKGQAEVVIKGKDGEWVYPLSPDREVDIMGPLGETRILIKDKTARIVESPCKNKICIAAGAINEPGQWIACLPNQVFVRIDGGERKNGGVDASVY
jgi:hypothetical protein